MECEYCGNPGKKITIDIPVQPKNGGYGASFGKHGENIEVVIYCDDCADTELVYHKDLIARDCDFEIYGLKIKE